MLQAQPKGKKKKYRKKKKLGRRSDAIRYIQGGMAIDVCNFRMGRKSLKAFGIHRPPNHAPF